MKVLLRVFAYVRRYPVLATATLVCALASTLMLAIFPAVTQRIIDDAIRGARPELLLPLGLFGLGGFFAQNLFNALRIFLNNHFEQKVIFDIRSDLYAHMQQLPLAWFDRRATGDIMTRLGEDVTSMERVLIDGIEQGSVAVLQIGVVVGVMVWYDVRLTMAALAPAPLLVIGALLYTITARDRYRRQRRAASDMNSLLHDNVAGIRQIKAYCGEEREHGRFNATGQRLREATLIVMRAWAFYNPSMAFLNSLGSLLVVVFGGWLALEGRIDIGVLVAILVFTPFLYEPITRLHQLNQLFQAGRAAGERVFEILDAIPEPARLEGAKPRRPDIRGNVRYEAVEFSHDGGNNPTLADITFDAPAGSTTALVGPTGAGKSSLINLLVRFYEFDGGEILLDGHPLRSYPVEQLRAAIALVTQESFLFNGTVSENLLIGKPDATEEELWRVLNTANACGFVEALPKGLNSQLGERGVRLSVGEKQRISIARALLKNPPILILDEATASVDTATERLIQQGLDRLMESRTCFVIAHRLSTVRHADQILVLDGGRIIERGCHQTLAAQDGLYAKLCRRDFQEGTGEESGNSLVRH